MRFLIAALALALSPSVLASPSDASLRELFAVTGTRQLADDTAQQADTMMQAAMRQALAGKTISPKEREVLEQMKTRMTDLIKQELQWERLEPRYFQIYRDTFSQEEVDGMLVFYKSPVGRSVVRKLPLAMQHTVQLSQEMIVKLMPKLKQIQAQAMADLQKQ